MGAEKNEHQATYRPLAEQSRFWFGEESCYTKEDLLFRQFILQTRASSEIHKDYLTNPSSWFAEDSQALVNVYENSWFFSNTYKTRHVLTRDAFHVQPVDSKRLQWTDLYTLMQKVGDYLLLRNQHLSLEHLNQPMNFFLLDVNYILKGLSQNPNIGEVKQQLELLNHYLRTIETNTSPLVGSDRLFLANFRSVIDDEIQPKFTHKLESQLLKEQFEELSKNINQLSTERNRILHFSLQINPVNPHPYDFSMSPSLDSKSYPTQTAKTCAQDNEAVVKHDIPSVLHLTGEQLKKCAHFKLISMDQTTLNHYASAISDLNELARFQKVIAHTMNLLSQAGEVYTIYQFKEHMLILLRQISVFIDDSSIHIKHILNTNTQAYHKAIQEEQDLSLWKKLFSSEQETLHNFINNQDTLAQFPSTISDLSKTDNALKLQVGQVISHLNQPRSIKTSFEELSGQVQELNALMNSMHNWIKNQYEMSGLEAPKPPEQLRLEAPEPKQKVISEPLFASSPSSNFGFFPPNTPEYQPKLIESSNNQNAIYHLGLISLFPIGVIALYLFKKWRNASDKNSTQETEAEFNQLK